jgi:hypothetical protein
MRVGIKMRHLNINVVEVNKKKNPKCIERRKKISEKYYLTNVFR